MHIYEYLFAAFITISILLASILMINIASEPLKVSSERENLKAVAHSLLTQILLNPGDPEDWGSNTSINVEDMISFGLAPPRRMSCEVYALDANKVTRLEKANPLYIPPEKARELLGLGEEYGFTIEILPAIDVKILEINPGSYEVEVKTVYGGMPIIGANITARMYYLSGQIYSSLPMYGITQGDGRYSVDFGTPVSSSYVTAFIINYNGMRVLKVHASSNVKHAYLMGNTLYLDDDYVVQYMTVLEVMSSSKKGVYQIEDVISNIINIKGTLNGGRLYEIKFVESQLIMALTIVETPENDYCLALASREINITYGTVNLSRSSLPLGFVTEKVVLINDFSYMFKLYIWRLVW